MATGTDAKAHTQTPLLVMKLSTHSDMSTYGDGTHAETDTHAGWGAKSGTEATHEHARTHRQDEQRCTQRDRHVRTRRFLQRHIQTIQNNEHAAAHTITKRCIYTQRSI